MTLEEKSDGELIEQCLSGNKNAWEALLSRYERLIYYTAIQAGANADEAEDIFQSVCLIWLEKLHGLRDPNRLGAWLVTITRREYRANWRKNHIIDDCSEELLQSCIAEEDPPELLAAQAEDARVLQMALQQIAPSCRKLIWLLYFDPNHPSYLAIASKMRIPVNSIGPTRARCLEKLREILSKFDW